MTDRTHYIDGATGHEWIRKDAIESEDDMTDTTTEAVERYRPAAFSDGEAGMLRHCLGDWVSWCDYAARLSEVERERDQTRDVLGAACRMLEERAEAAEAKPAQAREALTLISETVSWEINPSNYGHQEVCDMNASWCEMGNVADEALATLNADTPAPDDRLEAWRKEGAEWYRNNVKSPSPEVTVGEAEIGQAASKALYGYMDRDDRYSCGVQAGVSRMSAALRSLAGEKGDE